MAVKLGESPDDYECHHECHHGRGRPNRPNKDAFRPAYNPSRRVAPTSLTGVSFSDDRLQPRSAVAEAGDLDGHARLRTEKWQAEKRPDRCRRNKPREIALVSSTGGCHNCFMKRIGTCIDGLFRSVFQRCFKPIKQPTEMTVKRLMMRWQTAAVLCLLGGWAPKVGAQEWA